MATIIKAKNLVQGYQTILTDGKHSIVGDEPITSKGTDLGLSPEQLVLGGLAMCKVATVRYIARKNGWNVGEVNAHLEQTVKREKGKLTPSVSIQLTIEGDDLTAEQLEELRKQSDACYIHRLLNSDWNIETAVLMEGDIFNPVPEIAS